MNMLDLMCPCGCNRINVDVRIWKLAEELNRRWEARALPEGVSLRYPQILKISSGFRCLQYDMQKNRNPSSTRQHTKGTAIDVALSSGVSFSVDGIAFLKNHAIELGATGIGLYWYHIHIDIRDSKHLIEWNRRR